MTRRRTDVDLDHLVNEHGIDPRTLTVQPGRTRAEQRHLSLYLEMKHAADHAARRVDHDHDGSEQPWNEPKPSPMTTSSTLSRSYQAH